MSKQKISRQGENDTEIERDRLRFEGTRETDRDRKKQRERQWEMEMKSQWIEMMRGRREDSNFFRLCFRVSSVCRQSTQGHDSTSPSRWFRGRRQPGQPRGRGVRGRKRASWVQWWTRGPTRVCSQSEPCQPKGRGLPRPGARGCHRWAEEWPSDRPCFSFSCLDLQTANQKW